jgi:ATP-dependent helicase HrpB
MSRLETVRASLAAADQRRGRAGRTQAGVCYRMWPEAENRGLPAQTAPEIENADLAPLMLDLALWGESDPGRLRWVTPPPASHVSQARQLLQQLGAIDGEGRISPHGKAMAVIPAHPRLAHMIVRGRERGLGVTACKLAALLEERDVLRPRSVGFRQADLRLRLDALAGKRFADHDLVANDAAVRRTARLAERWRGMLRIPESDDNPASAGALLALAYPDRIARRRPGGAPRYLLANGRGAALRPDDRLAGEEWLAIADLDGASAESSIYLAAPLDQRDAEAADPAALIEADRVEWDERAGKVLATRQTRLGAIVLKEVPLKSPPTEAIAQAMIGALRRRGIAQLPFGEAASSLRQRVAFLRRLRPDYWPDLSDAALAASMEQWLAPSLQGAASLNAVTAALLDGALRNHLDWRQQKELDRLAPSHFQTPSGTRLRIDYGDPAQPALSVRLQELFGQRATPAVADGAVPLTLHLLSPAGRPIQVTSDLGRFWQSSYAEVRKEMRGRYPKHQWPEDPLTAPPSRSGRKPRGT